MYVCRCVYKIWSHMKNTGTITKTCSKLHTENSRMNIQISGNNSPTWSRNSGFLWVCATMAWCRITDKKKCNICEARWLPFVMALGASFVIWRVMRSCYLEIRTMSTVRYVAYTYFKCIHRAWSFNEYGGDSEWGLCKHLYLPVDVDFAGFREVLVCPSS
jgi:hypothetical protein